MSGPPTDETRSRVFRFRILGFSLELALVLGGGGLGNRRSREGSQGGFGALWIAERGEVRLGCSWK